MPMNSTRIQLYKLVQKYPELRKIMDVGITSSRKPKQQFDVELSDRVSMQDHARWKYLISADGLVAATRLAKLLGMNSVVLKETSPWIEYYNRATLPGVHFAAFDMSNITDAVRELERTPEADLKAMVRRAQEFQQFYLTEKSKVRRACILLLSVPVVLMFCLWRLLLQLHRCQNPGIVEGP